LANEYQTPPVYVPAVTGVMHHTSRDRTEIDPDAKGQDRTVAKAAEAPPAQTVRKTDEGGETSTKNSGSEEKGELGPKTDPSNLVQAQELASEEKAAEIAAEQHRAAVATAAEMVGAPEELQRLDENRDGRIDQLEVQHALRAKGDDSTYAALSHYQKTLGFGPGAEKTDKADAKAEKLFADDIAQAEKAKLIEKAAGGIQETDGDTAKEGDSPETSPRPDPTVKIVV
jgi:hypothetical protein